MDRATTYFNNDLSNIFEKYKSRYILIPPGIAQYLQPLDLTINKPFKNVMKTSDDEFRLKNNNNSCPSDDIIIVHELNNWYDDQKIKKETIIKSFRKTGISIKMNGEENNQICIPSKFSNNLSIPNKIYFSGRDKNYEYEIFKCSKYNDTTQPKINSIFKSQPKNSLFEILIMM